MVRRVRIYWSRYPRRALVSALIACALTVAAAVGVAYAFQSIPNNSTTLTNNSVNAVSSYTFAQGRTQNGETMSSSSVTFPPNTDISAVVAANCTGSWGSGTSSITKSGTTVNITWGTPCPANTNFSFTIANVRNPSEPGSYVASMTLVSNLESRSLNSAAYALVANATAPSVGAVTLGASAEGVVSTYTVPVTVGAQGRLEASATPGGVSTPNKIYITFNPAYALPGSPAASDITVNGVTLSVAPTVSGQQVTIPIPSTVSIPANGTATVVFRASFGLTNPAAGSYTLTASTSAETGTGTSPSYTITAGATRITVNSAVQPAGAWAGRGETLTVDGFTMQRTQGSAAVSVSAVSITNTGTVPGSTVSGAYLFRDDGAIPGVWDASDTQLNAAPGTFVGNVANVTLSAAENVNATLRQYWVRYVFASGASNGATASSRVSGITHTADNLTNNAVVGGVFTVDAAVPSVAVTAPSVDGTTLAVAAPYVVSGTATDAASGVSAVRVRIQRGSDGWYWNGVGWQSTETSLAASTSNGWVTWTYSWGFTPALQDGSPTYAITAFATDAKANVAQASRSNVSIDNIGPTVVSATSVSGTQVDVVFSERVTTSTAQVAGNYSINGGLGVPSAAVLQPGGTTVRLTTAAQSGGTTYTVTVTLGSVTDLYGNTSGAPNTAQFTGTGGPDTIPPTVPGSVVATAGTVSPIVATISWAASTDNVGVTGYNVWRSIFAGGPFAVIGNTAGLSFNDVTGVAGQEYYYRVSAYDAAANESTPSAVVGPITATWVDPPHTTYTSSSRACAMCHASHRASTASKLMADTGGPAGELSVCYVCHDGTGASGNIKTGPDNSFALSSGHALEGLVDTATPSDLSNACSSCHAPHRDYLLRARLWRTRINTTTVDNVTGDNNTWCFACHNDGQDWYRSKYATNYPSLASPTRDASGFPIAGTYPGRSTYTSSAANAHVLIDAANDARGIARGQGDCRFCHMSHRGKNKYDSLVETFTLPTTATVSADRTTGSYAAMCFLCHGGGAWEARGARDIRRHVTHDGANDAALSGHRIKSITPSLPVNAPLPCYECHNPHGSTRGNKALLSDVLGGSLTTTGGAESVRRYCLTCHSTWDGFVWESTSATYTAVTTTMTVVGLRRDGGTLGSGPGGSGYNWLKLKDTSGHYKGDTAKNCYTCHGNSYAAASSNNVHNPSPGVSGGATACYSCHTAYRIMDRADPLRQTVYHHALGTSTVTYTGDLAPGTGSYPTAAAGVFCVSCHTDHNYFNAAKGSNLRQRIDNTDGSASANSDYLGSSPYGICASCHASSLTKTSGGQKSDGTTSTARVAGADYSGGAHQYAVSSAYGASTFLANCSKCHNDEQAKEFQTSTRQFSTHYSAERRLLSAFGGAVTDPLRQRHCLRCHSRQGDLSGGKPTNGYDWYGTAGASMSLGSEMVYRGFYGSTASSHPVDAGKVYCENCHNPHVVTVTTRTVDPDNTYNRIAFNSTSTQVAFCLKCHDGVAPNYTMSPATYVPATVTVSAAGMNKTTYAASSHWQANGSISSAETKSCAVCHDSHGSKAPKLLGSYDPASDTNRVVGVVTRTITANNNNVCYACHTSASTGNLAASRNASGYPMDGTWVGETTYTVAYNVTDHTGSIHTSPGATWPGKSYAGGDCKNCHDVHGTANTFDELRTENAAGTHGVYRFSPSDFSFCFNCHDGTPSDDIKRYYPTEASGTAVQTSLTRFGHKTKTSGNLPAGSALPCYNCHNPHGTGANSAYGLLVVTQTSAATTIVVGDQPGEIAMRPADLATTQNVRRFCFTCHTTPDTGISGWNGSAMASVTVGARVEGIDRTSAAARLRLPNVNGHRFNDPDSCYKCHGNNYSGATTNNVHNPSGGVSGGGERCYGCHSAYQAFMEDGAGAIIGGSRTTVFHHVLGGLLGDGDIAPNAGTYPTSTVDVYCVSCHADHNYFNSNKGANLRANIASAGSVTTNTDFLPGTNQFGICLSCHRGQIAKDTSNQKSDGTTVTLSINATEYAASMHNYSVTTTFGTSPFRANCAKCHNDEQTKEFQVASDNKLRFGVHWSAERRIAAGMGLTIPASGSTEEQLCFRCHSSVLADNPNAGIRRDYYGVSSLTTASLDVKTAISKTYRHDVGASGWAGRHSPSEFNTAPAGVTAWGWMGQYKSALHVECEDCHNPHAARQNDYFFPSTHTSGSQGFRATDTAVPVSAANRGVWGVDISGSASGKWTGVGTTGSPGDPVYSKLVTATYEWQLCLKCHSRYAWGSSATTTPALWTGQVKGTATPGTTNQVGTMTDVGKDFNPQNYSYHPLFVKGRNQPSPSIQHYNDKGQTIASPTWNTSTVRRRIGAQTTGLGLTNTFVDGFAADTLVACSDCHNNNEWTAGKASGPHGSAQKWMLRAVNTGTKVTLHDGTVKTPNSGMTSGIVVNNYCVNCHRSDVYGNGDQGSGAGTNDETLSRMSHQGGGMASQCNNGADMPNMQSVGCLNCHGSRSNDGGQASGLLHGTSMGRGDGDNSGAGNLVQNGTLQGDEMGRHFCNGAAWDAHQLGTAGGSTIGCSTLNNADSYSSCTNHSNVWGKTATSHWTYN